jgi:hypothetical protein
MKKLTTCCLLVISVFFNLVSVWSVDFSGVPGVVINYIESPSEWDLFFDREIYITDPDILVLSNGDYIAIDALFGSGASPSVSGTTHIFRSTDKGSSWEQKATFTDLLRGSLFEHDGAVYILGANNLNAASNTGVILKSTNGGGTWTQVVFSEISGLDTPCDPVIFNDRIWLADDQASYSASIYSDFMQESSWTRIDGFPAASSNWLSGKAALTEAQIVASPELGVYLLPRVKEYALTTLASIDSDSGVVSFDPDSDYVSLPGGEKKFGATYDSASGKFYLLSNPVLKDDADSGWDHSMIRNTAAVLTSTDLRNWNVEKIYLYSTDVDSEGFQYMQFDFDEDDMVIVSRTAFDLPGENDPPRAHDSNLLTFNVLYDFRTNLEPDHILKLSDGEVLRYEQTYYEDAPLGKFALGTNFDGAAINFADGFGQASDGNIYIRESSGRILCFDASGNFQETVSSCPVSLQTTDLSIDQPDNGECTWTHSSSGDWF